MEATALWLVVLFASVTAHELSHSVVAMRLGLKVRDIVLLPIGGVSEIEGMDTSPQVESRVAIAGPLMSVAIGVICLVLALAVGSSVWPPTLSASDWLVRIGWLNLALAAFNLIPALPMDGGRVLRSLLARFGDAGRATRVAAGLAAVLGIGMIVVGVKYDIFLVLIGAFVIAGAGQEWRTARVRSALQALHVGNLMYPDHTTVPASVSAAELASWLRHFPGRAIPVVDEGNRYFGIASLGEVSTAPPGYTVGSCCDRRAPVLVPDMAVYPTALQAFNNAQRHELAVSANGQIVGVLYLPTVSQALARAAS